MLVPYLKPISKRLNTINPIVVIAVIQIMNLKNIMFFFRLFSNREKLDRAVQSN